VQNSAQENEIVTKIDSAVRQSGSFFEAVAQNAVSESKLNLLNRCGDLFSRFEFLRRMYNERIKTAEEKKNDVTKDEVTTGSVSYTTYHYPAQVLRREASHFAISAIEAFYSWLEHLFVHLAVIAHRQWSGEKIGQLIVAEWQEKYKTAIGLNGRTKNIFFNELLLIRRQLRNFVAHGAFGKNGETFHFHSAVGAVPVYRPNHKEKGYRLTGEMNFEDGRVFQIFDRFVDFLWNSEFEPGMIYLHESSLPTVLPYAKDGTYTHAMKTKEQMHRLLERLNYFWDQSENMDW